MLIVFEHPLDRLSNVKGMSSVLYANGRVRITRLAGTVRIDIATGGTA